MAGRRHVPVLALLAVVLLGGCTSGGGEREVAGASPSATSAPGCEADGAAAVCRFLTALDTGSTEGLTEDEQALLAGGGDLPRGTWEVGACGTDELGEACDVVFQRPGDDPDAYAFVLGETGDGGPLQVSYWEAASTGVSSELDGCPVRDVLERTACEYVNAVQTGDLETLRDDERVLAASADLPDGAWELTGCELVGDVSVECTVLFEEGGREEVLGLAPVNAEFDDGLLTTQPGRELDYAVG